MGRSSEAGIGDNRHPNADKGGCDANRRTGRAAQGPQLAAAAAGFLRAGQRAGRAGAAPTTGPRGREEVLALLDRRGTYIRILLYETLPSVRSYLFEGGAGGCAYLRVPDATANAWLRNGGTFSCDAQPADTQPGERPREFAVTLASPGIELFLSPHGAGVLSLAFDARDSAEPMALPDLNYRLSQVRPYTAFAFRLPHGAHNPVPPPAPDAPLAERLGRSGGAFRLIE
jgi:hypothetical protein